MIGAGVRSLRTSFTTAEQNSSWDSCFLVDTIPSLHVENEKTRFQDRSFSQGEGRGGGVVNPRRADNSTLEASGTQN